ncbi:hypothetical protein JYU20_00730 [Bacteroidales bacterium AH-315-I05]|nr:hypothetical protein [Bacteroidales bacterium AH-315-I05]
MIYLQIDWKATKKRMAAHIDIYNDKLKHEEPERCGKKSIKATHEATAIAVMEQFSAFLQHNENKGLTGRKFKTNNHAISTQRNNRLSPVSAWRHLDRLEQANVLTKQPFKDGQGKQLRSTNTGFEVTFNSDILVAKRNTAYCEHLVNNYLLTVENDKSCLQTIHRLNNERPPFSQATNGSMLSFCNHTRTCTVPVSKQNMHSGIPKAQPTDEKRQRSPQSLQSILIDMGQEQESMKKPGQTDEKTEQVEPKNAEQGHFAGGREKIAPTMASRTALMAWAFAKSMLWGKKSLFEQDIAAAKGFIALFFEKAEGNIRETNHLFKLFIHAIVLKRRCDMKDPSRFVLAPQVFFDTGCEFGFYRSLKFAENAAERRKRDENYYSNAKLLADSCLRYSRNPNIEAYTSYARVLGKKKDGFWLDAFNQFVCGGKELNEQWFDELKQEAA